MTKEDYTDLFHQIGAAALALGMENTHSGNISMTEKAPGTDEPVLYITKTGSKLGHLRSRDICTPGLDKITYGVFQASSETNIHRGILKYARAVMHAHLLTTSVLSFSQSAITPIDKLGAYHLGKVPIVHFEFPVGSQEMVEKIPPLLKDHQIMIVKTHGPFARGNSIKEVFYRLCLLEYSSKVLFYALALGVDIKKVQSEIFPKFTEIYPATPPDYLDQSDDRRDTDDEEIWRQFEETCQDIFYLELSPFHTGSASVRDGKDMLYASKGSTPKGLGGPILRIPLKPGASIREKGLDMSEVETHRAIYAHSRSNAVVHTLSPLTTAQGFQAIAQGSDRIIPVDAEGGYLYPAVPVLDANPSAQDIVKKLVKYKMVVVKGEGIWSGGNTLSYALHHSSSAKNLSYFRNYLGILHKLGLGPDLKSQEIEKGKNW